MSTINTGNVVSVPATIIDPNFFLPPGVVDLKYAIKDDASAGDDQGGLGSGSGTVTTIVDPLGALRPPNWINIVSQVIRISPTGHVSVDVTIDIEDVPGAVKFEAKLALGDGQMQAVAAQPGGVQPAFFFTPHQDDEALFMGAGIKQHVDSGRDVRVVLMTDGGSSGVCSTLYPGDRAACVAARDAEFIAGVRALGATPIIRPDRMLDGALTVAYAKSVINEYYASFNLGSFKTMSETDDHPDHSNLGIALRQSNATDKRWYMKPADVPNHTVASVAGKYNLDAVLNLYPIGKQSVPAYFADAAYPNGAVSRCYS